MSLKDGCREKEEVDILISTINLPFVKNKNVVIVSPFLKQEDLSRIQNALSKVNKPVQSQKRVRYVPEIPSVHIPCNIWGRDDSNFEQS